MTVSFSVIVFCSYFNVLFFMICNHTELDWGMLFSYASLMSDVIYI